MGTFFYDTDELPGGESNCCGGYVLGADAYGHGRCSVCGEHCVDVLLEEEGGENEEA